MNADEQTNQVMRRSSARLAGKLGQLARMAKTPRATGFTIPVVATDPDASSSSNIWLLADGRLRVRDAAGTVHEFVETINAMPPVPTFASDPATSSGWKIWFHGGTGELHVRTAAGTVARYSPAAAITSTAGGTPTIGSGSSSVALPADPRPQRYTSTWTASWGRILCAKHGVETGDNLAYGTSAAHGEQQLMLGFDTTSIQTALAGATIRQVRLLARNIASWSPAGISIHWGVHNATSPASSYSAVRADVYVGDWPSSGAGPGDGWRKVSTWIGEQLRDAGIAGLTVDQPPGATSYGQLDWDSVQLEITYIR